MAGGGRCPRRRSWIRRLRRDSKLGGRGEGAGAIIVKPGNRSSGEWICVRGHRIRLRGRMRVAADGDVYVPDSEDEESGVEVETDGEGLVDLGGIPVAGNSKQIAVGEVPADAIDVAVGASVDVAAEEGTADDVNVAGDMRTSEEMHPEGEEMHPKVAARLKKVTADMDPAFRDVFISMYKVMVPAFFKP